MVALAAALGCALGGVVFALAAAHMYLAPRARSLAGTRAAITGGSSGIGLAAAKQLAANGARSIALLARDASKLSSAAAAVRACASHVDFECVAVSADVTNDAVIAAAFADEPLLRDADLLLCCAGVDCAKKFEDLTATDFERVMQVNFHGTVNCVRAAAPGMRMRAQAGVGARPHIGLVGSMAGHAGLYGYTAYSASKFALRGFAEALRMEMQVDGVRVSLALPPDTDTPQLAAERATMPAVTRSMSGAGGEFSAERVAADILKGISRGEFYLSTGLDGWALKSATVGMAAQPRPLAALVEVLVAPLLRVVALYTTWDFNRVARKAVAKERAEASN